MQRTRQPSYRELAQQHEVLRRYTIDLVRRYNRQAAELRGYKKGVRPSKKTLTPMEWLFDVLFRPIERVAEVCAEAIVKCLPHR